MKDLNYLIYGSTALNFWFENTHYSNELREPQDLDVIIKSDYNNDKSKLYDYFQTNQANQVLETLEIYSEPELDILFKHNIHSKYLDIDLLYTLKLSHLSWDIKWDKHMKDAIFLKTKGAIFNKEVYDELTKLWIRKHGNKKVKMNVKNEDFFKENIKRKFNHEFLHEQFAFYDRPLNEKIRKDLNSPLCSEDLWNALSEEDKLKCAFEELMVLAAERYIFVEGKDKLPIRFAKIKMLKNMITSTTSGWFNLFLKINFDELIKTDFPEYFYEKINELKDK